MPTLTNLTQMTDAERQFVAQWYRLESEIEYGTRET